VTMVKDAFLKGTPRILRAGHRARLFFAQSDQRVQHENTNGSNPAIETNA
jgi:hypothetical protein